MAQIEELVDKGRIQAVASDAAAAVAFVDEARRHLTTAERAAKDDPSGAYALLYDAARKAVTAHMLANGYRPTARRGGHEAVARYAEAALVPRVGAEHVGHLDRMRRKRNRAEYGVRVFGSAEIETDLAHAAAIVAAVADELREA